MNERSFPAELVNAETLQLDVVCLFYRRGFLRADCYLFVFNSVMGELQHF